MRFAPFLLLASILSLASACKSSESDATRPPTAPAAETSVRAGLNDSFLADDIDVAEFIERFEGESREVAANHDAILTALELEPGQDVADVGAGTGLFLAGLSRAVGPDGRLYAVDISKGFVEHLRQRATDEGLANVEVVLCTERSTRLERASVDVVFVCDTYHHFSFPQTTVADLFEAVRPGGRLVVLDFHRIEGQTREWLMNHVRAGQEVFRAEIEAAGFRSENDITVAGLSENYVMLFTRPE